MHHLSIKTDDGEIDVCYNADWSGDVFIRWDDERGFARKVELPGKLLLELSRVAAHNEIRNKLISFLEDLG